MSSGRALVLAASLSAVVFGGAGALGACGGKAGRGATGGGSGGGAGGCPTAPKAMFTITVHAQEGPVPPDTSVHVTWSAGDEPTFVLNDPSTWKTLDDANLVCDVDRNRPPPTDLPALVCQLWTTGATLVQVAARGYAPYEKTLTPTPSDVCEGFLPKDVDVELLRADGGGSD